jgi:hypothetical protein
MIVRLRYAMLTINRGTIDAACEQAVEHVQEGSCGSLAAV